MRKARWSAWACGSQASFVPVQRQRIFGNELGGPSHRAAPARLQQKTAPAGGTGGQPQRRQNPLALGHLQRGGGLIQYPSGACALERGWRRSTEPLSLCAPVCCKDMFDGQFGRTSLARGQFQSSPPSTAGNRRPVNSA